MVKSKLAQIIYRSIYILIGIVGIIGSFGTFAGAYNSNWYLYYTNLSNYFCFFTVLALLIYDIKAYKKGEKVGETTLAPLFRFCVCIMILVTFLVYNTLLRTPFTPGYWSDVQSLIMHLILPVMFVVDYLIFSKHRSINVFAPLYACIMPLIYVFVILVRGEVYYGTGALVYPYFFLDAQTLGYGGVALYVLVLLLVFVALGYLVWAYDKLVRTESGKLKFDFSKLSVEKIEDKSENNAESENTNNNENKEE